jgi:hypothetical protein
VVTLKRRTRPVDDLNDVAHPTEAEECLSTGRAQVDAAVRNVFEALLAYGPGGGVHVLSAVGNMDVPVHELVVTGRRVDGYPHRRGDHVDNRLTVQNDVSTVHGRPPGSSSAYRPGVNDLAVVGDDHHVGGQVDRRNVAVTDHESSRDAPFAPGPATYLPAPEVARELDLFPHRPVGRRSEVQLDGTEPVPSTRDRLAHCDPEVRQHRLLRRQRVDWGREGQHDGLAHADRYAGARENCRAYSQGRSRGRKRT